MIINSVVTNIQQGGLPAEYQQVEYIGTSGTQYINLGITAKGTFSVFADFEITAQNSTWLVVWGAYVTNAYYVVTTTDALNRVNVSYGSTTLNSKQLTYYTRTKMNMTPKYVAWEQNYNTYNQQTFTGGSMRICSNYLSMKIYHFTINDENTPVIDLVPCYRIADSEIGMYDLVNGVFYTNSGTGTFTKGSDV